MKETYRDRADLIYCVIERMKSKNTHKAEVGV